ncbi:hypothetical protein MHF_1304 [Mycoplasma haemofelis Ohio2]|uniref:Uncharacterized protein n=1 Tax=Mycoplasma haemofelis (strain Ohio2) TaxID=859194 RepID=F6FG42_MYCHI|nr:hypothetical protein MHF_1304 [Mycoplasma haemofelis Ohio2]
MLARIPKRLKLRSPQKGEVDDFDFFPLNTTRISDEGDKINPCTFKIYSVFWFWLFTFSAILSLHTIPPIKPPTQPINPKKPITEDRAFIIL